MSAWDEAKPDRYLIAQQSSPRTNILPGRQAPSIGRQQAASRVKQKFPGNKILSMNLMEGNGPAVYRVKLLSGEGVIKSVFVNGRSGEVFE